MASGVSLHIGVNEVDPDHYDGWSGPLAGCENDARGMFDIASGLGFDAQRLHTADATRDAVLGGIDAAIRQLRAGDTFLLTYAGHGGQVPDTSGDEDDGYDETWCLYDAQLLDDELLERWGRFEPDVRVVVVSDSCHSGTVTRARVELVLPEIVCEAHSAANPDGFVAGGPRFMPGAEALRTFLRNREFYAGLQTTGSGSVDPATPVRLLSGCQDNQVSLDGEVNGLFTTVLLAVWDGGRFGHDYERFHRDISLLMPPTQSPNHFVIGPRDLTFDAERPFTI